MRRYKESIRKCVLQESNPLNTKQLQDREYVTNLIKYKDFCITLDDVIKQPSEEPYLQYRKRKDSAHDQIRTNYLAIHACRLLERGINNKQMSESIPPSIKSADMLIYGPSLAQFVIFQLISTKLDPLWIILTYILSEMQSLEALRILVSKDNWRNLLRMNRISNLDMLLSSICEASTYSVATFLFLRYLHHCILLK